eukprot:m.483103 g.483103  ORF g.483103 m.483103 type:complete len:64 (+) comp22779_c0_seq1:2273-2464(+)
MVRLLQLLLVLQLLLLLKPVHSGVLMGQSRLVVSIEVVVYCCLWVVVGAVSYECVCVNRADES